MNGRPGSRPGAQRKLVRLGIGLAASAALHASVLGAMSPAMQPRRDAPKPALVYAHVLPMQAVSVAAPVNAPTLPAPAGSGSALAALPASLGALPLEADTASAVAAFPTIDPPFDRSQFHAADSLAQRPAPLAELIVDYPAAAEAAGSVRVQLTIYIDEGGRVVHVESDAAEVPAAFVAAAKAAFLNARFSPGLAGDGTVKTQLRVEVAFELKDRGGSIG